MDGYAAYTGPVLQVGDLLQQLGSAGCDVGVQHYFNQEAVRCQQAAPPPSTNPILLDPLDKLSEIGATCDVTVRDLVHALKLTTKEVQLIQSMNVGQQNNPLWSDARQWWVTLSNFGKVRT